MATLRCTQKLLRQLRVAPPLDNVRPGNRLGDWYANALNIGRTRLVLCVSERTLLPAILPAREYRTLPKRLLPEIAWMLERIGVSTDTAAAEIAATEPVRIGRTASRQVLASLNVMADYAYYDLTDPRIVVQDLRATSLRLADEIYGQLGEGRRDYGSPIEATLRALGTNLPPSGDSSE